MKICACVLFRIKMENEQKRVLKQRCSTKASCSYQIGFYLRLLQLDATSCPHVTELTRKNTGAV